MARPPETSLNIDEKMKPNTWIVAVISGLVLACGSNLKELRAAETTTNLLSLTTFEPDSRPGWAYGYWYNNTGSGEPVGTYTGPYRDYYDPNDTEMTNGMCWYGFDSTGLEITGNYGTGFGMPMIIPDLDPTLFASSNRADYIFSWDARMEGLKEGTTTGNVEFQLQFYNSSQSPTKILQVNFNFAAGADWTHFVRSLEEGALGDGTTEAGFAAGYDGITGLQFNFNSHMPTDAFGFDGDNAIVLDNLKLEIIVRPEEGPPPPTVSYTMLDWNFDDKPVWGAGWGGYEWSANTAHAIFTWDVAAPGYGVDGSNAWIMGMNNSAFAYDPPAWAGGGTGATGPVDYSKFTSDNLDAYRLTFDARAEGLAPDRLTGTVALQFFVSAPDDTLQPADEDLNDDLLVQLDFGFPLSAEWQTFSITLNKGGAGSGSKDNFKTYYNKIVDVHPQWQIDNAASQAIWDYDTENTVVIDNIKLERVDIGCPPLTITPNGSKVVLTWAAPSTGTVKLQSSSNADGDYADVQDASSGYESPIADAPQYYRTVWVPPVE